MFAVIKTGGKQYKVASKDVIRIEKIEADVGSIVELTNILLYSKGGEAVFEKDLLGKVFVRATVINQMRDKKIIVFKKRRRHNYRRKIGHRQYLTVLRINEVGFN
jgi:large subunit ribosomal protein L21